MIAGEKQRLFFAAHATTLPRDDSNELAEIKQSKSNSAFSATSLSNLKKTLSIDNMADRLAKAQKGRPLKKLAPSSLSNCADSSLRLERSEVLRAKLFVQSQQAPLREKQTTGEGRELLATKKTSPVKALKYSSKQTRSSLA